MHTVGCGCAQADAVDPSLADEGAVLPRAARDAPEPLGHRQRAARAAVGVAALAVGALLRFAAARVLRRLGAPVPIAWALVAPPAWFGASHVVAAATAYRGCPEIGAIPSVVLGRRVETTCPPWDEIDEWLERKAA